MIKFEDLKKIDYNYSKSIASHFDKDSLFRKFFQISTFSGTAISWFIILPIWYFYFNGGNNAISMTFVFITMLFPIFIIKQTVRRPRPHFRDTRFGAVIMDKWSFPSGHASRSTYVMILMSYYNPNFAWFWILWGLVMISSRLVLGVHYISDIIGGILITAICLLILYILGWIPIIPWDIEKIISDYLRN